MYLYGLYDVCVCVCIYIYIYVYVIVSSPYLLMFGDDRVHGTQEHMMLQVDLVRNRTRAGLAWEIFYRFLLWLYKL